VTVIDGANDSVITTIPVGDWPYALVWNSQNNKVYCANSRSGNVTVIDGANNSVITTITVGAWPYALVWNSLNNKVYCANLDGHNVMVIDCTNDTVCTTIGVGDEPCAVTWNPIQNRTYVANYGSSSISVIRDVGGGIEERPTLDAVCFTSEIYPNPAKSVIRVRCPWFAKTIKIFDVSGKMIREIATLPSVTCNDREIKISLKGISPGIYFLKLGKKTKKFLVVK
jgi:YVTN family beta-propeller protein